MPKTKTTRTRGQSDAKAKPRGSKPETRDSSPAKSYSALKQKFEAQGTEFREALEREVAVSEILRMIARSPGDLQSILDATAANAAELCDAVDAAVWRIDGDVLRLAAHFGSVPMLHGLGDSDTIDRGTATGRAIMERQTIHVHDVVAAQDEFPRAKSRGVKTGTRTALAAPLLRDGNIIGAIHIRRTEVRPFTNRQIKVLETFANQAVIAIENARLFQERETRNRDLGALYEVATATSQSLELEPILEQVVKKITQIFAFDAMGIYLLDSSNEKLNLLASSGDGGGFGFRVYRPGQGIIGKVAETGEPIIFEDINTDPRYQELSYSKGAIGVFCFFALFPIKSKGKFLGTIICLGQQPRQLRSDEVRLINSMADQIGVAVENINLFEQVRNKTAELESSNSELREALEQQTATSEILRVIASSPTDIQPVLRCRGRERCSTVRG